MSYFPVRLLLILTMILGDCAVHAQSLPPTETSPDSEQPLPSDETIPAETTQPRPLRRFIGIGGSIGVSGEDTGLSEGGFATMSRYDLYEWLSIRGTTVFGHTRTDNAMALTVNFPIRSQSGEVRVIPFAGGGALISSKSFLNDMKVRGLVTGGIDVPLSRRFNITTSVNVGFTDRANIGVRLGVMYGFEKMNSSIPVLSLQNLNHFFGQGEQRKQVLNQINLDINAGEIVIMTGPSGSGKTTLLTLIGGLRSVQSGSLRFLGQELCGATLEQLVQSRRQVGYIFQSHNLHESLTAQQNVRMSLEVHPRFSPATMNMMAADMLQKVGLGDYLRHYPENLSGGQKQRVAIARALVSCPKLLLADEPTAALDSKTGRDVVNLMQYLAQKQGCTILLVTHDHRILDIADRIVQMEDGKLR